MSGPMVFSADWHVHPWPAHSEFDEFGVPDRLRDFVRLARDVASVGLARGAATLVLAGDLLHVNSPKPMAANVLREVLDELCGAFGEVLVIPGNHDVDQKSGGFDPVHSGLRALLPGHANLFYFDAPTVHRSKSGPSIYLRPWVHDLFDYEDFQPADVFVGHGLVVGTRDPFGHVFNSGFRAEELFERYRLSVVGDIHSGQVLRSRDGRSQILIPGQPVQVNYSSDSNCGVWVCDQSLSLSFVPQSEYPSVVAGERYHRFLSVPDASAVPANRGPKDHYKVKAHRSAPPAPGAPAPAAFIVDLEGVIRREWHALKPEHAALGDQLISDLLSAARPNAGRPARRAVDQRLEYMSVRNFMSIQHAEFDFAAMPDGDVLVAGPNGSGKTTMFEAFLWCYTGKTTKKLGVDKISNNKLREPAFVACRTRRSDGVYEVRRSRDPKCLLEVWKDGHNITKSSSSDTQEWIYESLLGVYGAEDLLTLMYFSVNANSNFSSFTPAEQFAFLGRLIDSELYEAFRRSVEERMEVLSKARDRDSGALGVVTSHIEAKEEQLALIVSARPSDVADKLAKYRNELSDQSLPDLGAVRDRIAKMVGEAKSRVNAPIVTKYRATAESVSELTRSVRVAVADRVSRESELRRARSASSAAAENRCPECGQELRDPSTAARLAAAVEDAERALSEAVKAVSDLEDRLAVAINRMDVLAVAKDRSDAAQVEVDRLSSLLVTATADASYAAAASQDERKKFLLEEIEALRRQRDSLSGALEHARPEIECVKLIKDKLTTKNSVVVSKIVAEVFVAIVAGMNEIVSDPGAFLAKAVTGKTFDVEVSFRGERPVSLDGMSVGERRLVDVLMTFSTNRIYCRHFGLEHGLLGISGYDEVFTYLDPQYLDLAFSAVSSSPARLRFVITHDLELMSHYSRVIRVEKPGGYTRYVMPDR